jgi:serine/threonine protein kinase
MNENRFDIIKELGKGSYGTVLLAFDQNLQKNVALKVMMKASISNDMQLVRLKREINLLRLIDHPNVVKLYEVIVNFIIFNIIRKLKARLFRSWSMLTVMSFICLWLKERD